MMLGMRVTLVPAGRLGDIIGYRTPFLIGSAMFAKLCVLGGMAENGKSYTSSHSLRTCALAFNPDGGPSNTMRPWPMT